MNELKKVRMRAVLQKAKEFVVIVIIIGYKQKEAPFFLKFEE